MKCNKLDLGHLQEWIQRPPVVERELIALRPARTLAALLDRPIPPESGDVLPPLWHWAFFTPTPRASEVGHDGHLRRGEFLPPIPFKRRMWAASQVEFSGELRIGQIVEKSSCIKDVSSKEGSSGPLVFVIVEHCYRVDDVEQLLERQTLVYAARAKKAGDASTVAPDPGDWTRQVRPDPVLLFRYSAITSNTHRIHYDREYAVGEEGYAGLVVQAPLTATLMSEVLQEQFVDAQLAQFRFRAERPLLDTGMFTIHGRRRRDQVSLWATAPNGRVAMQATATIGD